MRRLNIPRLYRTAIARMAALDDSTFEELRTALEKVQLTSADSETVKGIAASTPHVTQEDVQQLVEALVGLQIARSMVDSTLERFCDDLVGEIESAPEGAALKRDQRSRFVERLRALLSIESLAIAAKSRDLQTEHDHVFLNGRIITDLRPIFRGSPEESPVGVTLFHVLRVTYLDRGRDGERGNLYLALDDSDIGNLKKVLERAEVKSATLRKELEKSGIKTFGGSRT